MSVQATLGCLFVRQVWSLSACVLASISRHADDKGWTCQDFKTGAAKWQTKTPGKGSIICP